MNEIESSLAKLDRLMLRYRRDHVLRNQHYQDLCERYPSLFKTFQPPINHNYIYIHRFTSIDILNHLIDLASETTHFTIDAQNQIEIYPWAETCIPSLIQIQFHSTNRTPLVILIEVLYLTSRFTLRTRNERQENLVKDLFKQIFSSDKHIYAWGNPKKILTPFYSSNLFTSDDLDQLHLHDVHEYFIRWYKIAYPRSMINQTRPKNQPYTIQTTIFLVFNEWLNTKMQYSLWNIGIDTDLKTYHRYFSSAAHTKYHHHHHHLRNEIEYRQQMQTYALNNCFAITKLMFHILQQWPSSLGKNVQISQVIHYKRKKTRQTQV